MIERICKFCKSEFNTTKSRISDGRGKYCSRKCHDLSKRNRVKKVCLTCGQEFEVRKCRENTAKYCSLKCYDKSGKNNSYWGRKHSREVVEKMKKSWKMKIENGFESPFKQRIYNTCNICGKKFRVNNTLRKQKFCSRKCVDIYRSKYLVGENAIAWIDGRSFKPYPPEFNKGLKREIKERDGEKCRFCGITKNLSTHHIDYNKENNSRNNLITLCLTCNSIANGNRRYWKKYFLELIKI